ncbi:MAG: MBL fold metallo-hydrolase [Pseudomonadales bacterium]|nr:MBL fold metallo-hydrolase [Pseudomonadales bacterium]
MSEELIIEQIPIGPMQNFTYLLGSKSNREVMVVDPAWDVDGLLALIEERGYRLTGALITHYHPDHCGGSFSGQKVPGLAELLAINPVKSYVHKLEADGLKKVTGISDTDIVRVESGDKIKIGEVEIEMLHTPGHTPGSLCFKIRKALVAGDTLFTSGCGRVDLPGSSSEDMYYSLQKLAGLPDDTVLLPGHNYGNVPSATMADTKKMNSHLQIDNLAAWKMMMGE